MRLNIAYQNKDAAKTAFRQAGIPLTWNAVCKVWQTSADSLPASLAQYAPVTADKPAAKTGNWFYLAQRSGPVGFEFLVDGIFESKEDVLNAIVSGRFLSGWAEREAPLYVEALFVVAGTKRISVGKHIPNEAVVGFNRLVESKNAAARAALAKYL